jgi:hypothetical protein
MAATVKIKNGLAAVLEYLLSPLLRHQQGSLRERSRAADAAVVTTLGAR